MPKTKRQILLKGEGSHQHTIYGSLTVDEKPADFAPIKVNADSILKHEKPDGSQAEHMALFVKKGNYVLGKQVEYNPFEGNISQVWD